MLNQQQASFLFSEEIAPLIIPKEQVVVVHPDWPLDRALLVLTRKATNSVPVINEENQVEGLISKTDILDFILNVSGDTLDFSQLKQYKVNEVMNKNHSGILANSIFSFAFDVLINRSYIPIVNLRGEFVGILTRKVIMEKVTQFFQREFLQNVANEKS